LNYILFDINIGTGLHKLASFFHENFTHNQE